MKKSSSRPVRLATFVVTCILSDELEALDASVALTGEFVYKSDVHYCAEKEAIDIVAHRIEAGVGNEYTYLIYKVAKERDENDIPKAAVLVSMVYADENTNQVVID